MFVHVSDTSFRISHSAYNCLAVHLPLLLHFYMKLLMCLMYLLLTVDPFASLSSSVGELMVMWEETCQETLSGR